MARPFSCLKSLLKPEEDSPAPWFVDRTFSCRFPCCKFSASSVAEVIEHANALHGVRDASDQQEDKADNFCEDQVSQAQQSDLLSLKTISANVIHWHKAARRAAIRQTTAVQPRPGKRSIAAIADSLAAKRLKSGSPSPSLLARQLQRKPSVPTPPRPTSLTLTGLASLGLHSPSSPATPCSAPPVGRQPSIRFGRPSKAPGNSAVIMSKHNDVVYYPNIQCLLCKEWVCSRNRYMHIESHLQYKPYKCSVCGYDNRKEIFITLHITRIHGGNGHVDYQPDKDLEKRAWDLAEDCLQHTRQLLLQQQQQEQEEKQKQPDDEDSTDLGPYEPMYRSRIYNIQRAEKTQIIEESRQLGLLSEMTPSHDREIQCEFCSAFVPRSGIAAEEHVRSHLSKLCYQCIIPGCGTHHSSRNFMSRHMKEVHKLRKTPRDLLEIDADIRSEFLAKCRSAFPKFFSFDVLERLESKYTSNDSNSSSQTSTTGYTGLPSGNGRRGRPRVLTPPSFIGLEDPTTTPSIDSPRTPASVLQSILSSPSVRDSSANGSSSDASCVGCNVKLNFRAVEVCVNCEVRSKVDDEAEKIEVRCAQCSMNLCARLPTLLAHSLSHLRPLPFGCTHCTFSHWDSLEVEKHNRTSHTTTSSSTTVNFRAADLHSRWLSMISLCFSTKFVEQHQLGTSMKIST